VPYGVQQPPGRSNALGELKFLFPNSHDIYMHDTPNRDLFDSDKRAFSHGCVRVQNPRDFAAVLLGWDRTRIDQNTESRKSQSVKLSAKVPVHLTYFTAWPDETGTIRYHNDIYGRDETMDKARSAILLAQR
jgi:murein L,D-transpeptidase YcbB/YkuD